MARNVARTAAAVAVLQLHHARGACASPPDAQHAAEPLAREACVCPDPAADPGALRHRARFLGERLRGGVPGGRRHQGASPVGGARQHLPAPGARHGLHAILPGHEQGGLRKPPRLIGRGSDGMPPIAVEAKAAQHEPLDEGLGRGPRIAPRLRDRRRQRPRPAQRSRGRRRGVPDSAGVGREPRSDPDQDDRLSGEASWGGDREGLRASTTPTPAPEHPQEVGTQRFSHLPQPRPRRRSVEDRDDERIHTDVGRRAIGHRHAGGFSQPDAPRAASAWRASSPTPSPATARSRPTACCAPR